MPTLSKRQLTVTLVILVVAVLFIGAILLGLRPRPGSKPTIVFWGVGEGIDAYQDLFASFTQNTGIKVSYSRKDPRSYEQEVINALAAGRGPDVFMVRNTWILKHYDKLWPAPETVFTSRILDESYPTIVRRDFTSADQVFAVPLSIDTLALFYNRDLLDQASIPFPPKTWEELVQITPKLTRVDRTGILEQSAVALGGIDNVAHSADILSLLMIQSGSTMVDTQPWEVTFSAQTLEGGRSAGEEALRFFLQFAQSPSKTYTWSNDQINSLDAFSEGKAAMVFGYLGDLEAIGEKSPHLNYRISPMLQPARQASRADYASYWGLAVSRISGHPNEAWQLISYLTELPQARAYMRRANKPPARRELINEVLDERILGVFARQALTAQSWYQPDPSATQGIFRNMIESVTIGRQTPSEAVRQAASEINLLFQRFR